MDTNGTMGELSSLLQRERLLLELLVFKLTELGHLLAGGEARFLGWAAEEVERAVEAVRLTELERAVYVQASADGLLGVRSSDDSTLLATLSEQAPEPWRTQFATHRTALLALTDEVAEGLRATRRLAEAGTGVVNALLDRVGVPAGPVPELVTYGPDRTAAWSQPTRRLRTTL